MTMDISVQQRSLPSEARVSPPLAGAASPRGKRSFDVAFLVGPDENLAKRQQQQQQLRLVTTASLLKTPSPTPETAYLGSMEALSRLPPEHSKLSLFHQSPNGHTVSRSHYLTEDLSDRAKIPQGSPKSPETALLNAKASYNEELLDRTSKLTSKINQEIDPITSNAIIRSAFTKVNNSTSSKFDTASLLSMPIPPSPSSVSTLSGGGLSPDHVAYQGSISPPTTSPIPTHFLPTPPDKTFSGAVPLLAPSAKAYPTASPFLLQQPDAAKQLLKASRLYDYSPLAYPFAELLAAGRSPPPPAPGLLLPPSLAALSLPAQNVCAKCNVSFRMTSDLVYHMRSHHKGEGQGVGESLRRRREQDKLKCPVCNESFRERHHLTRHMTAHQDKEGDLDDADDDQPRRK